MAYRCPLCSADLDEVLVYSECRQRGAIDDEGIISDYSGVEEVFDTSSICCPQCGSDLMPYVREE